MTNVKTFQDIRKKKQRGLQAIFGALELRAYHTTAVIFATVLHTT